MAQFIARSSNTNKALICASILFSLVLLLGVLKDGEQIWASVGRGSIPSSGSLFTWHSGKQSAHPYAPEKNIRVPLNGRANVVQVIEGTADTEAATSAYIDDNAYPEVVGDKAIDLIAEDDGVKSKTINKSSAFGLAERGLFQSSYKTNAKKGAILLCYLDNPSAAKDKILSPWSKTSELEDWGWVLEEKTADYSHIMPSLGDPFTDYDFTNGRSMVWSQEKQITKAGTTYHPSNAIYNNVYWAETGIIFALDNHGPDAAIKEGRGADPWKDDTGKSLPLVKLKQWSDMAFLTWKSITTPDQRKALRWVF
ncbi:hypothetical protein LTR37_004335 [Vermiconidia calcicola]|uniref:Uncharacterized protein n=1 Tax=Vermiconidia calcicola TaxID=1690605 RepID=A0ACC3NNL0_9PEZI|nr:hypothetical protein LTR37_004335 [Vermiconidia calcicola]